MNEKEIQPNRSIQIVGDSEVPGFLNLVRPAWKSKNLINRVEKLIKVDPSSACQRLFNAAIHDLREKIFIAGIDIASEAAKANKLPPIESQESLENYSTSKLIDLAYRIGLITRPEWRRLCRCYDIRRDLEHEDSEYEAGIEDCVYIFKTTIEVVLSKDPIQLLKVTDAKEIIESGVPSTPTETFITDFTNAPGARQEEILKYLMSNALDKNQPDIVQQNAYSFLQHLSHLSQNTVKLNLSEHLQKKLGRDSIDERHARVAYAMGLFPYLRKAQRIDYFQSTYSQMTSIGDHWSSFDKHGPLLRSFIEVGGFLFCPDEVKSNILKWLVLTFIGVKGGQTMYGNVRPVFYSNTAAPLIPEIIKMAKGDIDKDLLKLVKDKEIKSRCEYSFIARRFESLIDLLEN